MQMDKTGSNAKIMIAITAILILALCVCIAYYFYNIFYNSPVSNTLSGKFWGMPYNLTMDQETTPWFKEPTLLSWLSLIASVPAAFAALWGLRKVEKSLETISKVIISVSNVNDYNFNFKETQTDDQKETQTTKLEKKVKIYLTSKPHGLTTVLENDSEMPITGILKGENHNTIHIETDNGRKIVIFKHAIATIEEITK
jgi:hypothetical protein